MAMNTPTSSESAPKRRGRPPKRSVPKIETPLVGCIRGLDDKTRRAIERATRMLEACAEYRVDAMSDPKTVRAHLQLKLAGLEREEFHAVWLDAQNRVIAFECLFVGTLKQTSVYPREVIKSALLHNAAAVIFAHNHPSGAGDPSVADEQLTRTLKTALALVDVTVLDHFIVAGTAWPVSFAELRLL